MANDSAIGAQFREWVSAWARAGRDSRDDLYDEIERADVSGFPREPALEALASCTARELWKTFDDEELGYLADWAHEANLPIPAAAFEQAVLDRPTIDDGKIPRELRAQILERDGRCCQTCGATEDLTIDHKFVPWSEGGSSRDPRNLQVLCRSCNSRKGARPGSVPAVSPDAPGTARRSRRP